MLGILETNKKKKLFFFALIFSILLISGCTQQSVPDETADSGDEKVVTPPAWMDFELTDVATGGKFRISDFKGKSVLMESFAVWCPTCTEQQKQTKELITRTGEDIVHISLDTDPNEDDEIVRRHIEDNGFDWLYAVSPIELTRALIDQFDIRVVNAPAVPMILICEDQSTRFLKSGIKRPDDLIKEVEKGC
jgi:cytochrome oxidase Cu insertion factor (SCO1/SenC/PrrC family)